MLAEMLAEDLACWPDDAWIVVDDYHHVCSSPVAELFVETLVQRAPVRLLISTRQRPSWVSTRSVLYGDVLEVGQSALAMQEDEVGQVLAGARDDMSPGLLALAGGWPAVIGLASLTSSPVDTDVEMPEELYEFFAEEVYRSLEPSVRHGLGILAVAPLLDRELAAHLLGDELGIRVCHQALGCGIAEERAGCFELHPLAVSFLEGRGSRPSIEEIDRAVSLLLGQYRQRREWDAAFELIESHWSIDEFHSLLSDSADELLNRGRLATLETWVERAEMRGVSTAQLLMTRSEVELRHGRHVSAQSFAESGLEAVGGEDPMAHRLLLLAARSAHAGSREGRALALYRQAEERARTDSEVRQALLGQLMCASALELDAAHGLLKALELDSDAGGEPLEIVRLADKRLGLGFRFGFIRDLADARLAAQLVPRVADPFARCSFRCALANALNLSSYYAEAMVHAQAVADEARDLRIDLALPYGHTMMAAALAGQRAYSEAHDQLDQAAIALQRCNDVFGQQSVYASRVRILLQEGRVPEACAIEPPDVTAALPSMRGEVLGSRGLVLASIGRTQEAHGCASAARECTTGIEAVLLAQAIDVVSGINQRLSTALDAAEHFLERAFEAGGVDIVVTAYRANPDLLAQLLSSSRTRERAMYLLARAGDQDIATALVGVNEHALDPRENLSRREREVYDLVCQGLSNAGIAQRLFISEATVKAHMHHMFDKLGVRSRTALALNAARERIRQAAPAIASDDVPSASSDRMECEG